MKTTTAFAYMAVVAVLVIAVVMFTSGKLNLGGLSTTDIEIASTAPVQTDGTLCASTLSTTLSIEAYNVLNDASEENFNVTGYLYDSKGSVTTITDTETPATTTINCGESYTFRVVSSNADGGDAGRVVSVRSGNAQVLPNGEGIQFVASGAAMTIALNLKQHGLLEFRIKDNDADGYLRFGENLSSAYTTDGATFTSTGTNATATAVGSGETLDLTYDVQSTEADTDFSDFGVYVLIDAITTSYEEPLVVFDGKKLSDVKGNLNVNEARLWAGYEYVYFIDQSIVDKKLSMNVVLKAISSVDPSTDVEIDFASKGAVKETLGKNVIYTGATDAASPAAVYTVQDTTIDIS